MTGMRLRRGGARADSAATDLGIADPGAADPGVAVHRLAVLLQAGLAPNRAWWQLAQAGDADAVAIVRAMDAGGDLPSAIASRGGAWPQVALAWRVAATVGAPLAASLRDVAEALRDAAQARDEVTVALAEPAATARLMAWLPLVAVALVVALDFDVVGALTQPLGIVCLGAGVGLMLAARAWTRRLVARAQPDDEIPGLACDVTAIALSGGVSIERALTVVADADVAGADARSVDARARAAAGEPAPTHAAPDAIVAATLELSRASGAPAVELLRAAAADARRRVRTEGRLRAARLSTSMLLPLGVCTLPAFLLLGVGPMLLSVLATSELVL